MTIPKLHQYAIASTAVIILNEDRTHFVVLDRVKEQLPCIPGGKIDMGEKVTNAAVREAKEECGLDIEILEYLGYSDEFNVYVSHYFTAKVVGGELTECEPDKLKNPRWEKIEDWVGNDKIIFANTKKYVRMLQDRKLI